MIGPTGGAGSLPPYLDVLAEGLRRLGVRVDRLGAPSVPYDQTTSTFWPVDRIIEAAEELLSAVDLNAYDLLSVHYGNLEVEQVIAALWLGAHTPPTVYHVHSLDWTLFADHVPDPELRSAVESSIHRMDGLVFFGEYGRTQLARKHNVDVATTVAWLPSTIPARTLANPGPLRSVLTVDHGPLASLYGYAAPWKHTAGLIAACQKTKNPSHVIIAGPFWDSPIEAGADLTQEAESGVKHGRAHLDVVAAYLYPQHRKALVQASDFAVFPYRSVPTFQGSGAIADYLAHGVPILATEVANMAELIGDAGQVVTANDPDAFALSIDQLVSDPQYRNTLRRNANRRATQFTGLQHAANCLRLYDTVIARTKRAT
ncbi:glycosyltransferase family 4 protein [Nocardia nepalensis]|uniref:glycosyltransferase family 4 protein n=1 Tax=Nocardia nepalensis TaxID=3375448 RepID=UPI003B67829B